MRFARFVSSPFVRLTFAIAPRVRWSNHKQKPTLAAEREMSRAIWKAKIVAGDESIPVKLYSAVQDRQIHFHLLHDQDHVRLEQRMINTQSGRAVPYADTRRGYQIEPGLFVMLEADELQSLQPAPSREIEITHFVGPSKVERARYVRPYWLGPDGEEERYFALATALQQSDKLGIARWVMRKSSYVGALEVQDGYLLLTTLRTNEQLVDISGIDAPSGRELSQQERQLAKQLVTALSGEFDADQYRDEYRARVRKLLETKRKGGDIELEEYQPKPRAKSLAQSLRSSLQTVK
jgi:DNA end-binding protein Ku